MVEVFPILPATRTFLGCHQTILPQTRPPTIATHRLIQTLSSQGLVVLLEDAVMFRNPRYYLQFSTIEMVELEPIPLQVMKSNLKQWCKFKNLLSSILGDARQVLAPVYKVRQSDILSRVTIPI